MTTTTLSNATVPATGPTRSLVDGEVFLWLGTPHVLQLVDAAAKPVALADDNRPSSPLVLDRRRATRETLIDWYRARGSGRALLAAQGWASRGGIRARRVQVTDLGSDAWADCHGDLIRIDWAAFQLATRLVEFLVLRELLLADRRDRRDGSTWCSAIEDLMPDWQNRNAAIAAAAPNVWRGRVDGCHVPPIPDVVQPVQTPATRADFLDLARAGRLIDHAGRPLTVFDECPACDGALVSGDVCPASIPCPRLDCAADARHWCLTPGGRRAIALHSDRRTAAEKVAADRVAAGDSYVPAPWPVPVQGELFSLDLG